MKNSNLRKTISKKNRALIAFIALLFLALGALLFSLRQILSEEKMKQMVLDFVSREMPGAKAELSGIHLNFRRTLQIHFDDLDIKKGSEFSLGVKHVMLSIPYGNFIFRSGKFDVRIQRPIVSSSKGPTILGVVKTIELMKSIPSLVGLAGEANVKLYEPMFNPDIKVFDFYYPVINRLVVNNIGRNHEMALEVLGGVTDEERQIPFSLIGSLDMKNEKIQASLALDKLMFPFDGYFAQNVKLKVITQDHELEISGDSEDLVVLAASWSSPLRRMMIDKLFLPVGNTRLSSFWSGQGKHQGLLLTGEMTEKSQALKIEESPLSLSLGDKLYEASVQGLVGSKEQSYAIKFELPNEGGELYLDFEDSALQEVKVSLHGIDIGPLEKHPLVEKVKSLIPDDDSQLKVSAVLDGVVYDQFKLDGKLLRSGSVLYDLIIGVRDSNSKLKYDESVSRVSLKLTRFPCRILANILKTKSPDGICSGNFNYSKVKGRGDFNFEWEPEANMSELVQSLDLTMAGALEQVWALKGNIIGDEITVTNLGGRRFQFVGEARGSVSKRNLFLNGDLRFKKKKIAPVNLELSTDGIKIIKKDEQ